MTTPKADAELDALIHAVDQVFGVEAVSSAHDRAHDRAVSVRDRDDWLTLFHAALKDELRRLLRPH
jgi:hypothetical protein